MNDLTSRDRHIPTPKGRLFARQWLPAAPSGKAPFILLHDSLGSVALWRDFPARLAALTGRPVIAYDRLGFGKSDPYPGRLRSDFISEEARSGLHFIRESFGIGRMILFGHSVGGGMAVASGAAFPDETEAVITLAAQAFVENRTIAGLEQAKLFFRSEEQMDRLARYHGDKAPWVLGAWLDTWLDPSFAHWSLDEALRGLRCPILAIHGDKDEYGSEAHPKRIAALAPGRAEVAIIPDCGHVPHREKLEEVLQLVERFLRSS